MTIQNNNNNLNYLTDPTFINANRLFVLSVEKLVQKITQQKILETLFLTIMYQTLK